MFSISAGEGWGRPHVEAMASGTPIIATNWSGPTEFMSVTNSLPLRVRCFVDADNWPSHKWADPDLSHLEELLLYAYTHREHVKKLGQQARLDIERLYSLQNFYNRVLKTEFDRIISKLLFLSRKKMVGEDNHLVSYPDGTTGDNHGGEDL